MRKDRMIERYYRMKKVMETEKDLYGNYYQNNPQIELSEILSYLRNSDISEEYLEYMRELHSDMLYKSEIHGQQHIIRTCLWAYLIGKLQKIDKGSLSILLSSAMYHDIGRVNDLEDKDHGLNGAKLLNKYRIIDPKDLALIQGLITSHSLDDDEDFVVFNYFDIKDQKYFRFLANILKDADALDRNRVLYFDCCGQLDPKYLRTNESKKLVKASNQLLFNYYSRK